MQLRGCRNRDIGALKPPLTLLGWPGALGGNETKLTALDAVLFTGDVQREVLDGTYLRALGGGCQCRGAEAQPRTREARAQAMMAKGGKAQFISVDSMSR